MKSSIIGFPRVGKLRELKFASEKYFKGEISQEELFNTAKVLRLENLTLMHNENIDYIPCNDFSFYDNVLDTAFLINAIPKRYKNLNLDRIDTYFAMARGYQGKNGDVKALSMRKWFNTNYHYLVPELDDDTTFKLNDTKIFDEYLEAKNNNIETKPCLIGPFTFLKLAKINGSKSIKDYVCSIIEVYEKIIAKLNELKVKKLQIDEPILVTDLTEDDIDIFKSIYLKLLSNKKNIKIILNSYFGDMRDIYKDVITMDFDAIGIDFLEGKKSLSLLETYGFPEDKILFAGVINGKNIWKCNYEKTLKLISDIRKYTNNIVLSTSCSLLHVPYTLENEVNMKEENKKHFSFAKEKLKEINELKQIIKFDNKELLDKNKELFKEARLGEDIEVQNAVKNLKEEDFNRNTIRSERLKIQKDIYRFPLLPTTTIGSFPQSTEVKRNRKKYKNGEITKAEYDKNIEIFIDKWIQLQEDLGLDILVHGEFERNDMVEFFGENLSGYVFTEKAWVQSYGTRCVKPPIVFGDIKHTKDFTAQYIKYAASKTDKYVKGMLTGPITILNWSFVREDISLREMAYQVGLAIREEVNSLTNAGIKIIQIDEAALREKLPLRRAEWYSEYLDFAIKAFRLCSAKVREDIQIHTHMCYSEFSEIVKAIDDMDADVISFESSRSNLSILEALKENNFETEVGPGVYDIHSPRVPSVKEIEEIINKILVNIDKENLWINPDCGLKTRGEKETIESLRNMVLAAKNMRKQLI